MDYDGMLNTFSITEAVKALLYYGEGMLAEIMRIEKETGNAKKRGKMEACTQHARFHVDTTTIQLQQYKQLYWTGEQASVIYVYDASEVVYNKQLVDVMVGPLMALAECMFIHYVELIKLVCNDWWSFW